jgi:hypothetical protein
LSNSLKNSNSFFKLGLDSGATTLEVRSGSWMKYCFWCNFLLIYTSNIKFYSVTTQFSSHLKWEVCVVKLYLFLLQRHHSFEISLFNFLLVGINLQTMDVEWLLKIWNSLANSMVDLSWFSQCGKERLLF